MENWKTKEERDAESKYLEEAIRLAELRMEQQSQSSDAIQRKAVWLITFCLTTAAYLYAVQPDKAAECFPVLPWKISIIASGVAFFIAVGYAMAIVNIDKWWVPGERPFYTTHPYFDKDFCKMAHTLLYHYQINYEGNKKVLARKEKWFDVAKEFGFRGITAAGFLLITREIMCL